ncbi:MAG: Gfo/Idh/MocA family oxidoreductase [Verrucomicrobia bacterium]|nr:Gfo/Idh/MocA family oxidoreductase [Verrucomicrobiota bacterium]
MSRIISRRHFLRASVTVASALAFPNVIPASVLGANAPSKRINVANIGQGWQGRVLLSCCHRRADVQVVAVCDVHKGVRDLFCKVTNSRYAKRMSKGEYKGCKTFEDYRELLQMSDLDAVTITVPDHWHGLIAVAACKAGKDVYCEKPLALTNWESRAIADAAKQYGTVFQTGSQQRSNRAFRFASELVRNRTIGKVKEVWVSIIGGPSKPFCDLPEEPVPAGLNWDFWLGPSPWRPYNFELAHDDWTQGWANWRGYGEFAGGALADFGAHHFDIAQWGLGADHTGPVEVIPPDGKDVKNLTYTYADGAKMYVGNKVPGSATQWIGEKGWVAVNRGDWLQTEPAILVGMQFGPNDIHLYESKDHFDNWFTCIRSRRPTICTAEIGHRTATICQIGIIAFRLGRALKWDPKAEKFPGDEQANRLLSRAMRAPWTL